MSNKVSIIIPVYNSEKTIIRTLSSIEKQTYTSLQIIIIDDGSDDNSYKLIKEYEKCSKMNIKIIKQFNQNAAVARNKGIEIADGEYVLFLDSDDTFYSDKSLQSMISKIGDSDLLINNYYICDNNYNYIYNDIKNIMKSFEEQYKYVNITPYPSSKLYNLNIIKKNNLYFSNVRIGQDLNFYLKYLLNVTKVSVNEDPVVKYNIQNNGMTRSKNFNFLDIYNSINEVKKYYIKNNKIDYFNKYIIYVGIKHFTGQMTKVSNYKNHYERKYIFNSINFYVKDLIRNNMINYNKYIIKELIKYYLKRILLKIGLFNIVKKNYKK